MFFQKRSIAPAPAPLIHAVTLPIDEAVNPFVKMAVAYWRSVCGQRRFPARADLSLRGLAAILPYAVILSVIEAGVDYEFRYVGDAQRQAFKTSFRGMRVTQIEAAAPQLGAMLREVYELARADGAPFIVRGRNAADPADSKLLYHETVFLPLGAAAGAVDHLLVVGVQIPEPFWDLPAEKLANLTEQIRAPL